MKETVRSLRWYFGIIGTLGALGSVLTAAALSHRSPFWDVVDWALAGAASAIWLYAAFRLPQLLRSGPRLLVVTIDVLQVRCVIGFLIVLSSQPSPAETWVTLLVLGLSMALLRYVKRNLLRLAAESTARDDSLRTCPECGEVAGEWRDTCACGHAFAGRPSARRRGSPRPSSS